MSNTADVPSSPLFRFEPNDQKLVLFLVPILIKPSLPLSASGLASGEEGGDLSPRSISMLEAEEGAGKQVGE